MTGKALLYHTEVMPCFGSRNGYFHRDPTFALGLKKSNNYRSVGGRKHLEIFISRPSGSTLMLIHSSELSQAEADSQGITDLHIYPYQLSCDGSVVLLHYCTAFAGGVQP